MVYILGRGRVKLNKLKLKISAVSDEGGGDFSVKERYRNKILKIERLF